MYAEETSSLILNGILGRWFDNNTQISWKIAEKNLKTIEKSWESSNGNPFEYKDININNIINKNGFKKIVLKDIENEIQESVQGEIDFNEPILISQEKLTLLDNPELIMKSENTKNKHLNSRGFKATSRFQKKFSSFA